MGESQSEKPQVSGCPMHSGNLPAVYGAGDLSYPDYLKINELLSIQKPQSSPAHHDEMLFIIIHQAYELWFRLILHELETAVEHMRGAQVLRAHHFLNRVVQIQKLLVNQIHILETMSPIDFLGFRDQINPASGFQSIQFREIEFMAGLKDPAFIEHFKNKPELAEKIKKRLDSPDLRTEYYRMLRLIGFNIPENAAELESQKDPGINKTILAALLKIYQRPQDHLPLYLLSESLIEFDEYLSLWRDHHVRVVERILGFKRGTGGSSGVAYLQSTTAKKCFPLLWEVRTHLKREEIRD